MRMPLIAATVTTAIVALAAPASAQVTSGAMPKVMHRQGGMTIHRAPMVQHRTPIVRQMPRANVHQRWGRMNGGRWYAGGDAPGGWKAYRRPVRGWSVPPYWMAPTFYVHDWGNYGLRAPATGYNWARYYDDAVLIDGRGRVQDSVSGVDWYGDVDEETYASAGPTDGDYGYDDGYAVGPDGRPPLAGAPYPPPGPAGPPPAPGRRRDNGIGGALIGGAVGAVAGNVIAGRGNRLGGSLIGAGVGAIAGAVIDRNEDRGRGNDRRYDDRRGPGPGAGYAPPQGYPQRVERRIYREYGDHGPTPVYQGNGVTVVTNGGGHYGYGATTTVITVQPAVTTTTTTRDYVYETVRAAPRKRWKAKPRCVCPPSKLVRR